MAGNTPRELYQRWTFPPSKWNGWVKPLPFVQLVNLHQQNLSQGDWSPIEAEWMVQVRTDSAIVLDLPGEHSVCMGLGLAKQGFHPIPLFNGTSHPKAILDLRKLLTALWHASKFMESITLRSSACPAFLLDRNRMWRSMSPGPGLYDNRWFTFAHDFPSGNFLLSQDIRKVEVIQDSPDVHTDLAHVLKRWADAGLELFLRRIDQDGLIEPLKVKTPNNFGNLFYRALALLELRRNSAGGFGSIVPDPMESGGGFG